jgi:deoxyribose-phosphate aldolase
MEEQLTSATRELIYNDIENIKEEIAAKERIIKFVLEEGDENRIQFLQIWRIEVEMMHHQVYFLKTKLFT